MKIKSIGTFLLFFSFIIFISCDDDGGPTGLSGDPANIGQGSDYLNLQSNQTFTAKLSATTLEYDTLGNLVDTEIINNRIESIVLGAQTQYKGLQAYPVFVSGDDDIVGFFAASGGELLGLSRKANEINISILPADLEIGDQWIANPQSDEDEIIKVKIEDFLSSYTTTTNKEFNNVLKVIISHKFDYDTTVVSGDYVYTEQVRMDGSVTAYFAKSIGLVEAVLTKGDEYYNYTGSYPGGYYRGHHNSKTTGVATILD